MTVDPRDPRVSRRGVLGAAAAGVAAAAVGATPAAASGDGGRRGHRLEPGDASLQAVPATTPGLQYHIIPDVAFHPLRGLRVVDANGAYPDITAELGLMSAAVALPAGTVVREFTVWMRNTSGAPQAAALTAYPVDDTTGLLFTNLFTAGIPNGNTVATPVTATSPTGVLITAGNLYTVDFFSPGFAFGMKAARLGVQVPGVYTPVSPGRVYDSREALPNKGTLANDASRTISVADKRNTVGGAVVQANFVPVGAKAVTANVTIVATTGPGVLAVNPGGVTTRDASTINWNSAGQVIANGVALTLNSNRELTAVCYGGGVTDFIIDVTGYYT